MRNPARGAGPAREGAAQAGAADPARETPAPANPPADPDHEAVTPTPATAMPAHRPEDPAHRRPTPATAMPAHKPVPAPERSAGPPGGGEPDPESGEVDLAHGIADAVRRCPDVVDLSGGPFGTVATYLPGEKVSGVALHENGVDVSIVAKLGRPLPEIADEVRAAVGPMAGDRPVNVHIGGLK